jgi:hypothetical protein
MIYEANNSATRWKDGRGNPIPQWNETSDDVRQMYVRHAKSVQDNLPTSTVVN